MTSSTTKESPITKEFVFGALPESLRHRAAELGVSDKECLFCLRSDLDLERRQQDTWLIVTPTAALAVSSNGANGKVNGENKDHRLAASATLTADLKGSGCNGGNSLTGPFDLANVQKVRSFQTVGSAFLQFMIDGLYVDVIRYSNARREMFDRARLQIERVLEKQPLQNEALTRPSDRICNVCGMPLAGRAAPCQRCQMRRGIFRRTLGLMRPYRGFVGLLLAMMIGGVSLDLLPPLLTRTLVDKVLLPRRHIDWLPLILLGLVGASAGRGFLNVFIGRTSSMIGTRITKELRERLQRKLLNVSVDYYDRHSVGSLMSRVLYDVDYFQGFVVQVAQGFLLNLMLVLGIGSVLFTMNWHLAILVLLPIPFVIIGTTFFYKHIYPRYYRSWDSQSKMAQLLSGLLSGIRLVKAFGQEEREQQRFAGAASYLQNSRRSVEMSVATFNPIMAFIFSLGGLIIWYAGGNLVFGQKVTLGTLMAFFGYLGMFYAPISSLSMFSNWVTGFMTAGQRVFEVLDANTDIEDAATPVAAPHLEGAIEFRNVTFGYDPYNPILKNVSFKIEPGQFIGIVGKSGSGKTTIVNLVCRFYDAQQGDVLIDGVNVQDISREDLHRQVGLVLQEPFLFRASIAENIAYGRPDAKPMEIQDAAKSSNAHDFIAKRASGYDTQLGERGAGLSGGERQRISIARALLCDPRILILDEATSSVDTESEQEIQQALAVLGKGRTTIAIAHRLSTLKNSDRIFVVDEGRITESGTHEELLALEGIYYNLVRIQTELTRLEV